LSPKCLATDYFRAKNSSSPASEQRLTVVRKEVGPSYAVIAKVTAYTIPLHSIARPTGFRQSLKKRDSIADIEGFNPVLKRWPASIGMGSRLPSESVAGLRRNQWPPCVGLRSVITFLTKEPSRHYCAQSQM
jgi:hypothetical protein